MSLFENMPDRCTIQRRVRTKDTLAGSSDVPVVEQTNVECWEQAAGASASESHEKRGIEITTKVYFVTNPGVSSRHQIIITSRRGTAVPVADQVALDVVDRAYPDASAGFSWLWRVMAGFNTGE